MEIDQRIEENQGLVWLVATKCHKLLGMESIETYVADGMYGLWHAATRFDPNRSIKFSTYATRCIYFEILRQHKFRAGLRKNQRSKTRKYTSLNIAHGVDVDRVGTACGLAFVIDAEELADQKAKVETVLKSVPPRHANCFRMRASGCKLREIGRANGITSERARQLVDSVIERVKERFVCR